MDTFQTIKIVPTPIGLGNNFAETVIASTSNPIDELKLDTTNNIIIECPHCDLMVQTDIKEINCKIFRHGISKHNYEQIDSHLSKAQCDEYKAQNLIYGCGKPYELVKIGNKWHAIKCEYK